MNIPRNLNGNIVYDSISNNSIVITSSTDNLSYIEFDKGILVNNAEKNVPSFQSYNGILYYNNDGTLTSTDKLSRYQLINTDNNGNLSMTTLAQNSIIYTSNDRSIRQLKFERDQLFYVGSNGNLMNYDMKDNKILYIQDSTLNSVDITSNKNLLLYVDNQQEFPTLSTIPLESNSILYTNEDEYAKISQLRLYPNQIISTDGSKNLQGYNLSANSIIYIDNDNKINFIQKNNGILNTYNFAVNTVSQSKYPQFTDKIVLNNCEIVTDSGRIKDNYLIYGKSTGGLSNINIPKVDGSSYNYYCVVEAGGDVNVSSSSQIYTDLYNKEYNNNKDNEAQTIVFNAIPICTSNNNGDDKNMNLNVLVPNAYEGNYYINSDGDKFSLKLFSNGSIEPSQLKTQNSTTFYYTRQDILTVGTDQQRNDENQVFNKIAHSEEGYDFPYLSGSGWADLKTVKFLNSNNCFVTNSMNYGSSGGPLVASSTGDIYKVTLPEKNKYVLTRSCFSQLKVDGKDLRTVATNNLNLKNILQISDDTTTITTLDNIVTSGILHTNDKGNIIITQLNADDDIPDNTIPAKKIQDDTITADKIQDNTITGLKLSLNTSTLSGKWNNILLNGDNLIKTSANVTNYGVFASNGNVTDLNAQVLNSVGLKFFTPTTNEGKIDESSYFATKFTVYSSNSGNIDYNCSYYSFANYNSIISFNKKMLCNYSIDQNKNLYNNSINNTLSNTYKIFYKVISENKIDKYIKINTSIYINSVTFTNTDLTDNYVNNKNLQFTIDNLKNNNLKLIVGVYTNLYNNNNKNKYYDIMYVNNSIYQLQNDITGGINDMLLGYVIVDTKNLVVDNNNDIYTATINKQYDFESYININSSFENFDYSPQNILTFRPLYYIDEANNTSSLFYYNTSSSAVNDFIQNFTYDSIDYYEIGQTTNYVNVLNCSVGNVELPDGSVYIDKINNTLAFAKKYGYAYNQSRIIFNRTNVIFENNDNNKYEDGISTIISEDNDYIYMHLFINKPFESNLKFNIKPITTYTHIKYNKSSSTAPLTNPEFIFSVFNFTLTVTDYVGEYPSIIQ